MQYSISINYLMQENEVDFGPHQNQKSKVKGIHTTEMGCQRNILIVICVLHV